MENLDAIHCSSLFAGIDESDLRPLLLCLGAWTKDYKKGEYVFSSGDSVSQVYIVVSGRVQLTKDDVFGNRMLLETIINGGIFAEAFACVGVGNIGVSAMCVTDCRIMLADYRKLITTCSSACAFHSRLVQNMMLVLAQKNLNLEEKIEHLSKRTTREKLLSYLSAQSQRFGSMNFNIPYNRQELADYLCVERSAMSHELAKMKRDGLIDYHKNTFRLLKNS